MAPTIRRYAGYRERWIPRLADRPARVPGPPAHRLAAALPGIRARAALIDTFCAAMADAGAAGMHVCVVRANTPALGFYDRLGFRALDVDDPGPVVYLGLPL
jgi:hypothetical protein